MHGDEKLPKSYEDYWCQHQVSIHCRIIVCMQTIMTIMPTMGPLTAKTNFQCEAYVTIYDHYQMMIPLAACNYSVYRISWLSHPALKAAFVDDFFCLFY